jgi:hypothetical protein
METSRASQTERQGSHPRSDPLSPGPCRRKRHGMGSIPASKIRDSRHERWEGGFDNALGCENRGRHGMSCPGGYPVHNARQGPDARAGQETVFRPPRATAEMGRDDLFLQGAVPARMRTPRPERGRSRPPSEGKKNGEAADRGSGVRLRCGMDDIPQVPPGSRSRRGAAGPGPGPRHSEKNHCSVWGAPFRTLRIESLERVRSAVRIRPRDSQGHRTRCAASPFDGLCRWGPQAERKSQTGGGGMNPPADTSSDSRGGALGLRPFP